MERYAVLISGGYNAGANYSRYINDLKEIYKALLECGHKKENITVLYADGTDHDLDGDGSNESLMQASNANLTSTFQGLKNKITHDDILFVYATNHGGSTDPTKSRSKLYLWGESIEDSDFANLVNALSFKLLIVTLEQCYSGGFIDDLHGPDRVIATACRCDEVSYACDSEGNYDEFVYHWTAAVRGKTPSGTAVDADSNNDGKVSLKEAFTYAEQKDSRPENPQYYEFPAGLGDLWTLCGLVKPDICLTKQVCCTREGPCLWPQRDICFAGRDIPCGLVETCPFRRDIPCSYREEIPCAMTKEAVCDCHREMIKEACLRISEVPCTVTKEACLYKEGFCSIVKEGCFRLAEDPCDYTDEICRMRREIKCYSTLEAEPCALTLEDRCRMLEGGCTPWTYELPLRDIRDRYEVLVDHEMRLARELEGVREVIRNLEKNMGRHFRRMTRP